MSKEAIVSRMRGFVDFAWTDASPEDKKRIGALLTYLADCFERWESDLCEELMLVHIEAVIRQALEDLHSTEATEIIAKYGVDLGYYTPVLKKGFNYAEFIEGDSREDPVLSLSDFVTIIVTVLADEIPGGPLRHFFYLAWGAAEDAVVRDRAEAALRLKMGKIITCIIDFEELYGDGPHRIDSEHVQDDGIVRIELRTAGSRYEMEISMGDKTTNIHFYFQGSQDDDFDDIPLNRNLLKVSGVYGGPNTDFVTAVLMVDYFQKYW
jgi:hypothetical protein